LQYDCNNKKRMRKRSLFHIPIPPNMGTRPFTNNARRTDDKSDQEKNNSLFNLYRHFTSSHQYLSSMFKSLFCCFVFSDNRQRSKILSSRLMILLLVCSYCFLFLIYNFAESNKYSHIPTFDIITYEMLRHRPRTVYVNRSLKVKPPSSSQYYEIHHRYVEPLSDVQVRTDTSATPLEEGDCKAMHDWQLNYQPACNSVHEINMMENRFLAEGGFRSVWWMRDDGVNGSEAVMKVLSWKKSFKEREKERHRRDATAYAMLQGSPHIPNIYGYCTNTAIFDVAKGGTLEDMLEDPDLKVISQWKPEDKLRYAWQVTKAVADVHSVGNIYNSAAISHTDIGPSQYLWIDGMFKLNDFNRARFIRWDDKKKEACPFFISVNGGEHRSPEEYTEDSPLTEKIDVFSLGNILWSIVMEKNVYTDVNKTSEVSELVKSGQFVSIPPDVRRNLSIHEKAIAKAMNMCLVTDVNKRRTSIEVEKYLHRKLKELGVSEF